MGQLRYESKEIARRRIRARNGVCYTVIDRQFIEKHIDAILKKLTIKSNFRNIIKKMSRKIKRILCNIISYEALYL